MEHDVRDYLIAGWGHELASDIGPLEIQRWLKSLHTAHRLAWTTVSKIHGIMHPIYKVGVLHERVEKDRVSLHFKLALTCAATALRASEIVCKRTAFPTGLSNAIGPKIASWFRDRK